MPTPLGLVEGVRGSRVTRFHEQTQRRELRNPGTLVPSRSCLSPLREMVSAMTHDPRAGWLAFDVYLRLIRADSDRFAEVGTGPPRLRIVTD